MGGTLQLVKQGLVDGSRKLLDWAGSPWSADPSMASAAVFITDINGNPVGSPGGAGGALVVQSPQDWSITHDPGVNAQASAVRAAVAGSRHICTSILGTISTSAVAAAGEGSLVLLDGATVLWKAGVAIPVTAGGQVTIAISGLNIAGTIGNSMTLQFSAGAGVNTNEVVSLTGHDSAT